MALRKLIADLSIISKLGTNPGVDNGLSEEQIKAKFDEAANIIKDYLNNYLILEIEKTVDVESLLSDILDVTLSKSDKAANAAATGEAIRSIRSFFEKVVHGGDYVLNTGNAFSAEVVSNGTVQIQSGIGVIQGNLFSLEEQEIRLQDGVYGLRRSDLIVVRANKDEENNLHYAFASLTGTDTSGEPVDPVHTKSDLNADGILHEFPVYRVLFDGLDIVALVPLFEAEETLAKRLNETKTQKETRTLTASSWSASAPYIQTVEVSGLTDEKFAIVYPDVPEDAANEAAFMEEVGKISSCRRSGNTMTFRCLEEKPGIDIPVIVEVSV